VQAGYELSLSQPINVYLDGYLRLPCRTKAGPSKGLEVLLVLSYFPSLEPKPLALCSLQGCAASPKPFKQTRLLIGNLAGAGHKPGRIWAGPKQELGRSWAGAGQGLGCSWEGLQRSRAGGPQKLDRKELGWSWDAAELGVSGSCAGAGAGQDLIWAELGTS